MTIKYFFFLFLFFPIGIVAQDCGTKNTQWSKCEKNEDCTIINDMCNWPKHAVNKKFAAENLKLHQCLSALAKCVSYNHVRDGKWNPRCAAKTCVAIKDPTDPKIVCEKSGGTWDTFVGRGHVTGCNLPTKDAGKKCERGEDCESVCLKDRTCYQYKEYRGCAFFKGHAEIICVE